MSRITYKDELTEKSLDQLIAPYAQKIQWFMEKGYTPHYWQLLFHCLTNPDKGNLTRFRHIVAGRRGGKTMSAGWEVLYYALHPEVFHWHAHKRESHKPLHIWVLTKDHVMGRQSLLSLRNAIEDAGLVFGKEYRENKGHKYFEFENGSLIEFKTAEDPERLRGAGLDILWIDEAAIIDSKRSWEVVRPALSDKQGLVMCTTTPLGKNWYYDEFWSPEAMENEDVGRVEYRSIDNPYFAEEEWMDVKATYHPMQFRQEYMASFDAMEGKELHGSWLHYYSISDLPSTRSEITGLEEYNLKIYIGIDPAASLADEADHFAAVAIGVTKDNSLAYILEVFKDKIDFPQQIDLIQQWHQKYRPIMIGIESVAYQKVLIQQASRIAGMPPIIPMAAPGRKFERILSMSPLFKLGKVRIRKEHLDFIEEWLNYDSTKKNPKDDVLDATEIALRTAGVLLSQTSHSVEIFQIDKPGYTIEELMLRDLPTNRIARIGAYDDHMGEEW